MNATHIALAVGAALLVVSVVLTVLDQERRETHLVDITDTDPAGDTL